MLFVGPEVPPGKAEGMANQQKPQMSHRAYARLGQTSVKPS